MIRSEQDDLTIPLRLRGVISLFDTHKPTEEELANCRYIHMTSDQPWDPYDPSFEEQERAVQSKTHGISTVLQNGDDDSSFLDSFETCSIGGLREERFLEFLPEDEVTQRFVSAVNIPYSDCAERLLHGYDGSSMDLSAIHPSDFDRDISAVVYDRNPAITKEILSERWGIGLDTAHRTLRTTTQRGVRTCLHPSDRRVSTRQPHLVFLMIKKKMYTDTAFAKVKSIRQNTCAQNWTDGQAYTLFYPLRSKSEAHTMVSRMVHDMNAIPQIIVSDGAKEEGSLKWNAEIRLIRSRHHVTEPYSQWQN
jgi:hypothetical protein